MSDPTATDASQNAQRPDASSASAAEPQASLVETAHQALKAVTTLGIAVDAALQQQLRRDPYVVLATAAGAGLVLGASPIGRFLLKTAVRAFGPRLMTSLVDDALRGQSSRRTAPDQS